MQHHYHVGKWVHSHFRSTWKGVIIEPPDKNNCVIVRVEIDQHSNPMRKKLIKRINIHWLTPIENPVTLKK